MNRNKLFHKKKTVSKKKIFVVGGQGLLFDDALIERVNSIGKAQEVWIYDKDFKLDQKTIRFCRDKHINVKYQDLSIATNATKNAISDYCLQHQKHHIKNKEKSFDMEKEL